MLMHLGLLPLLSVLVYLACALSIAKEYALPTSSKSRSLLIDVPMACQEQVHRGKGGNKDVLCGPDYPVYQPVVFPPTPAPVQPTCAPTNVPIATPSFAPISTPTVAPITSSTFKPTEYLTAPPIPNPTFVPTANPTYKPSAEPTCDPTAQPTANPTNIPTASPTAVPTFVPTTNPTASPIKDPTRNPTPSPTAVPTASPTCGPTATPTANPTCRPTARPTSDPSSQPTRQPSSLPSRQPSSQPSASPTRQPSTQPSRSPTGQPTSTPTRQPSGQPSCSPTRQPSGQPSSTPTRQLSSAPTSQPSRHPSICPTSQPSFTPTGQPTGQTTSSPSAQPSAVPSAEPSVQPTANPSAQPSSQPTSVPSIGPTTQSTGHPSAQPTAQPSTLPSFQPSFQPNSCPTSAPSGQPSAVPTTEPSIHPSIQLSSCPSSRPTAQPSSQPRGSPSGQPTGEWTTIVAQSATMSAVFHEGARVWACGKEANTTVSCYLTDATTGSVTIKFRFEWCCVISVMESSILNGVIIQGQKIGSEGNSSELATCTRLQSQLHCDVLSVYGSVFIAASYVPYPKKYVHVGLCNIYTCISIRDAATGDLQSYVYTAINMKTITLSQAVSPPYFVGAFVAGTSTRATAAPVSYIVVGMVRTEAGIFGAMALTPVSGDISSEVDLVCTTALEPTGPDSFIAGALQLDGIVGKQAYLIRANALFMTVQYCVRYRSIYEGSRRMLAGGLTVQSAVRGMVLFDQWLYMIVDHQVGNISSLVMVQTSASTGSITKQVHITASNDSSLQCYSIVATGMLLTMVCRVYNNTSVTLSILLSVDRDLSFDVLPVGCVRSDHPVLHEESIPFTRTVLTITKSSATLARSTYEFNTADQSPTRIPSGAPTRVPSEQPSSTPSAQPTSNPTAPPSVSPQPTSQPSSAVPTITHKPSVEPTALPTQAPTVKPPVRPSLRPTPQATARPNTAPLVIPTAKPTSLATFPPTRRPSKRRSCAPSIAPSMAPSVAPSLTPSIAVTMLASSGSNRDSTRRSPYVVGASIGAGLGLLLVGYVVCRYVEQNRESKAREVRKAEYFRQQAILVEQTRAETAKYIQEENDRIAAIKLEKEIWRVDRLTARRNISSGAHISSGGAYATSPVHHMCAAPQQHHSSAESSSSVNVSTLHSSELSAVQHTDDGCGSDPPDSEDDGAVSEQESSGVNSEEPHSSELSDFADNFMNSDESEDGVV